MKKLEHTEGIIKNIFDPRVKSYNVFVDVNEKQVKRTISLDVKIRYIEYYLKKHWEDICGQNLSKNCMVDCLQGNNLIIRTKSSLFANELFMMKKLLLRKINEVLDGRMKIKDLKFHTGKIVKEEIFKSQEVVEKEELTVRACQKCGVKIISDRKICTVCDREQRKKLHKQIVELLKVQPWLSYEECVKYINCSKIEFLDAKESIANIYYEKVRLGYADDADSCMAVMFLTGKNVQFIDEKIFQNSIEYLRRKQDVPTYRI